MKISLNSYFLVILILIVTGCDCISDITPVENQIEPTIAVITTTAVSTMTADERREYIEGLFENNGRCDYPCYWGFTPGITDWSTVNDILVRVGIGFGELPSDNGLVKYGVGGFSLESIEIYTDLVFGINTTNVIENITVSVEGNNNPTGFRTLLENYSPDLMLLKYGKPSRILLFVSTYGTGKVGYSYWLFYDHNGFAVNYSGSTERTQDLQICPSFASGQDMSRINLFFQQANSSQRLDFLTRDHMEYMSDTIKDFQEATGISIDEYYEQLLADRERICFSTPIDIWK